MTKKEKLLNKVRNNPKAVRFEEIDKILLDVGFERTQPSKGSSHYTYIFGINRLTIPCKKPFIKVVYIKKALDILEQLGL